MARGTNYIRIRRLVAGKGIWWTAKDVVISCPKPQKYELFIKRLHKFSSFDIFWLKEIWYGGKKLTISAQKVFFLQHSAQQRWIYCHKAYTIHQRRLSIKRHVADYACVKPVAHGRSDWPHVSGFSLFILNKISQINTSPFFNPSVEVNSAKTIVQTLGLAKVKVLK